jgi:hypothetical protein
MLHAKESRHSFGYCAYKHFIYIVGGYIDSNTDDPVNLFEAYNTKTDEWI